MKTPTSTVRLKAEECRLTSGGCRIKSDEGRVYDKIMSVEIRVKNKGCCDFG
jgi:hypothetical protein